MGRSALVWISVSSMLVSLSARAERQPMQSDFNRCAQAAVDSGGGGDISGEVRFELLIRKGGRVYAAYVNNERGIANRKLERCITNRAPDWDLSLTPAPLDYLRPYTVRFVAGGAEANGTQATMGNHTGATPPEVMLPDINSRPPLEALDPEVARATLEIADFATPAERGQAQLAVKRYPEAIKEFRAALGGSGEVDAVALRGLAQALAESGGDLKEAREAAERLIAVDPSSEAGHEALVRVCLAAHDDLCAFEQFKLAKDAKDNLQRGYFLKDELQPEVAQAAQRLQAAQRPRAGSVKAGDPAAGQDPCATEQGEEKQALCVVKRCLDAGSAAYAKELAAQNGVDYVAGEWRTKLVGTSKMLVTREIAAQPKPGAAPPPSHNALWLVTLGDQLKMTPTNSEARQITISHNACATRVNATGQ